MTTEDLPEVADATEALAPMSIFELCETDTAAEEDGKWFPDVDVGGTKTGIDVKLRRFTAKASMKARQRLELPYRRHQKRGAFPDDINIKILVEQMAEAIVLDWRNVYDRDGEPIPYSKDACRMLLTKLPNFRAALVVHAMDMDNFRIENREDVAGN